MQDTPDPLRPPQGAAAAAAAREAPGLRRVLRPRSGRSCLRLAARATLTERDFTTVRRALAAVAEHTQPPAPAGQPAQAPAGQPASAGRGSP